jgi:uncharacterized membrane protein
MKKSFRLGLSVFIPIAIVIAVFSWFYSFVMNLIVMLVELFNINLEPRWWFVFPFVIGIYIVVVVSGFALSKSKLLRWIKRKFDKVMTDYIPMVKRVYSFGLEISDALIDDGKLDGAIKVVEFDWNDNIICIGLLTNAEYHLIASATTPNPTNGFLFKVHPDHYEISDMTVEEYGKIVISMGKLMGWKWRRQWRKTVELINKGAL